MTRLIAAQPSGNEEIADWIEYGALGHASGLLPVSEILEEAAVFGIGDIAVNLAMATLKRREKTLGKAYPFLVNDYVVRRTGTYQSCAYSVLLLLTRSPGLTPWRVGPVSQGSVELFENLTCEALRIMLGPVSQAINFGWPSSEGRPPEFFNAVPWLANKMGVTVGSGYRPPRRKDGGVDVVAWRPFADGKSGFPIYLVQCTLQQDVLKKTRDIDLRLWAGWLALDSDPVSVLSIPRTIGNVAEWNEISANSVLLDRIRLAELLGEFTSTEIEDFIENEIACINEQLLA